MLPSRCKGLPFYINWPLTPLQKRPPSPNPFNLSSRTLTPRSPPSLLSLNCYMGVPNHRKSLQSYCVPTASVSTRAHVLGAGLLLWKDHPALEWPMQSVLLSPTSFLNHRGLGVRAIWHCHATNRNCVDRKNTNMGLRPTQAIKKPNKCLWFALIVVIFSIVAACCLRRLFTRLHGNISAGAKQYLQCPAVISYSFRNGHRWVNVYDHRLWLNRGGIFFDPWGHDCF